MKGPLRSFPGCPVRDFLHQEFGWWASYIPDIFALAGGVGAGGLIVTQIDTGNSLVKFCGPITAIAIGLCLGAVVLLGLRIVAAWRFWRQISGGFLASGSPALRGRFLAISLQECGVSKTRCSPEDLRRVKSVAMAEALRFARDMAMPASAVAFLVPAFSLIGGWNAMRQADSRTAPIGLGAPSMIVGITASLLVVILVELLVNVFRGAVTRWAGTVGTNDVVRSADNTDNPPGEAMVDILEEGAIDNGLSRSSEGMSVADFENLFRNHKVTE